MRFIYIFTFVLFSFYRTAAQSVPQLYKLSDGQWIMNEWDSDTPAGEYPLGMIFHTYGFPDPSLDQFPIGDWVLPYNLTTKSRINGLGEQGISFHNTSTKHEGSDYLGAAVLRLEPVDGKPVKVQWTARIIDRQERVYGLRLEFGRSLTQPFVALGDPIYSNDARDSATFETVLPDNVASEGTFFLRWRYFHGAGDSGARSEMAIDDIYVSTEEINSVEIEKEEKFQLYPNPNLGSFTLEIHNYCYSHGEIKIFDITGREVYSQKEIKSNIIEISLNNKQINIDNGLYQLIYFNDCNNYYTQFVILL